MAVACNPEPYVPNNVLKQFVVTIEIPVGFKLKRLEDGTNGYTEYISMDRNTISRIATQTPVNADLYIPNGPTLSCSVEANTLTLKGSVLYNAIVSGFIPGSGMIVENDGEEIVVSNETGFSHAGIIEIDEVGVYGCPGCDLAAWYSENYHVQLVQGETFLINHAGDTFNYRTETSEFFEQLDNAEATQVIHLPLILKLVKNTETP